MTPKKQQTFKKYLQRTSILFFLGLGTLLVSFAQSSPAAAATDCSDVYTPLSSSITNSVNANKADYVSVMNSTGVPWEMLAAIHYRETSFSRTNPSNGQGIFQFAGGEGGPYPAGPVSDAEFRRQLKFMANKLQSDYVWRGSISRERRTLKPNEQDTVLVKDTLFSYNGRATVYANQAAKYGYSSSQQPYEGSPYVMNRFDCKRARMGIITRDYGSLDGTDTRYGAFTLFARLRGESYWLSLQSTYSAADLGTTSYVDQSKSKGKGTTDMRVGDKAYVVMRVVNTGSKTWTQSNTYMGTVQPRDRSSAFAYGWPQKNRAARMQETSVAPGQTATFSFWYAAPNSPGKHTEHFSVVVEGKGWAPYFGLYLKTNVQHPTYTGQNISAMAYTDSTKATNINTAHMAAGQRAYIVMKVKNTGNTTWTQAKTRMGANRPADRSSQFYDPTWLSKNRLASMQETSVAPGGTATFAFWYKAPMQSGNYHESFAAVVEGVSWVKGSGVILAHNIPHYAAQRLGTSAYTDSSMGTSTNISHLTPGQRVYMVTRVQNAGSVTWTQATSRLATVHPNDRASAFHDSTWPGSNRVASMQESSVAPGGTATFKYWYKAPTTPKSYTEDFSVVLEGTAWIPFFGLSYTSDVS